MRSWNQPSIVRMFFIGLLWEEIISVYQIIIENDVYMWAGTLNVTINELLCKYNVTFIRETPIFTQLLWIFSEK